MQEDTTKVTHCIQCAVAILPTSERRNPFRGEIICNTYIQMSVLILKYMIIFLLPESQTHFLVYIHGWFKNSNVSMHL